MQSENGGMTIKWLLLFSALPGGYRNNNGNFNNQGNNGNWWSATENDASNAYNRNLNCNNENLNRNNNNKGCGFSVRLLRDLTGNGKPRGFVLRGTFYKGYQTMYADERQRIVTELFQAYFDARRNKRNTINALAFEKNFEHNIFDLADEILEDRYTIRPSICFIVNRPVKREIFAANFRDRVVHHFIYNYIYPLFDKLFINDAYSCRVGKGTHYGIGRVDHFFRSCSQNYTRAAFVLKLDIQGYFMAMDKAFLLSKVEAGLHEVERWANFNLPLTLGLIKQTIFNDPREKCIIKGRRYDGTACRIQKPFIQNPAAVCLSAILPHSFSPIFISTISTLCKTGSRHTILWRYVDDFVLVHHDKSFLISLIPKIADYLKTRLHLTLHPDKIYCQNIEKGVKYLGAVIKPHRNYIAKRTTGNFYSAIEKHNRIARDHKPSQEEQKAFFSSINSYLGILKHYRTYRLRLRFLLCNVSAWWWNHFSIKKYLKLAYRIKKHKKKSKKKRKVQSPVVGAYTREMGQWKRRRKINRRWNITQQAKVDMRKAARSTVGRTVGCNSLADKRLPGV